MQLLLTARRAILPLNLKVPFNWALCTALTAIITSLFLPNYYKSEARILPVESKGASGLGNLAAAAASLGVNVAGNDGSESNFSSILNSRWLKSKLTQAEFVYSKKRWLYGSSSSIKCTVFDFLEAKNTDQAVSELNRILAISQDLKSNLITITAQTTSPEASQVIVCKATELLNQFVIQNAKTRSGEKAAFAEKRLIESRQELDEAERHFRVFLDTNRNYQMSNDPSIKLQGNRLEAELSLRRQLVATIAVNREQALLASKNDVPIVNILDYGNLPIEKSGPSRSLIVLMTFILTFLVLFLIHNIDLLQKLFSEGESAS